MSHGWHDRWIAKQMASLIAAVGAEPFIDFCDIKKGKRIIPILPTQDATRIRELPAGIQTLQALDGSRLAPDALARSIVATLYAA
jgi:hypothetical protein